MCGKNGKGHGQKEALAQKAPGSAHLWKCQDLHFTAKAEELLKDPGCLTGSLPCAGAPSRQAWAPGLPLCGVLCAFCPQSPPRGWAESPILCGPQRALLSKHRRKPFCTASIGNARPIVGFGVLFREHSSQIKEQLTLLALGVQSESFLLLRNAHLFFYYVDTF